MRWLRISLAAGLTAGLGWAIAFGGELGPAIAHASKTTIVSTTTSYAGNSSNVKGVSTTTTTKAGNGGGGGETKGISSSTTSCAPTGNPSNNFSC